MEDTQKLEKSQFFEAVTSAIDNALQLKTDADSILMVIADGQSASHLVGGNTDVLLNVLLAFMEKNPLVAEIVCRASLEYHIQLMQQPILKIIPPPVPEDGVAQWPTDGKIFVKEKEEDEPRYVIGVDTAKEDKNN